MHFQGVHRFGTHLSLAGVAPRVAQAAMRHSDIKLTMNTYTDSRLLDTAEAVESLPIVRGKAARQLAPMLAPNVVQRGQFESISDQNDDVGQGAGKTKKPRETLGFPRFCKVGATGFEPATSASRTQRSTRLSHAPCTLTVKQAVARNFKLTISTESTSVSLVLPAK